MSVRDIAVVRELRELIDDDPCWVPPPSVVSQFQIGEVRFKIERKLTYGWNIEFRLDAECNGRTIGVDLSLSHREIHRENSKPYRLMQHVCWLYFQLANPEEMTRLTDDVEHAFGPDSWVIEEKVFPVYGPPPPITAEASD